MIYNNTYLPVNYQFLKYFVSKINNCIRTSSNITEYNIIQTHLFVFSFNYAQKSRKRTAEITLLVH